MKEANGNPRTKKKKKAESEIKYLLCSQNSTAISNKILDEEWMLSYTHTHTYTLTCTCPYHSLNISILLDEKTV